MLIIAIILYNYHTLKYTYPENLFKLVIEQY